MNLRGRNKVNPNFNMSSMTDIVFLLLIFFMLTTSFIQWQHIELAIDDIESTTLNLPSQSIITVDDYQQYLLDENIMTLTEIIESIKKRVHKNPKHLVLVQPVKNLTLQKLTM